MEEDKFFRLKRFDFLTHQTTKIKNDRIPRHRWKRYYVKESRGVYLTEREAEVSCYVTKGFTIREIATEMTLSPRTVEFYLTKVRRKLRARNRNELIRILYENDLA